MEKMTNVKALAYVVENFGADLPADVAEKLDKIKASFEKKSENRKPSANQEKNAEIKETILKILEDAEAGLTVSEILKADASLADYSLPKITALVTQLKEEDKVERYTEKKKAYFRVKVA